MVRPSSTASNTDNALSSSAQEGGSSGTDQTEGAGSSSGAAAGAPVVSSTAGESVVAHERPKVQLKSEQGVVVNEVPVTVVATVSLTGSNLFYRMISGLFDDSYHAVMPYFI